MSMKYANKLLERLERKGHLKRYATGRYELAEKPLAAFMPEAVAVGGIVHRVLGGAVVVGPRVHGLQFSVRFGEAGIRAYRSVSEKK
jgi:predicted transcriptional regulator of viral defense system